MTTLTVPRRLMGPVATRPARRSLAVGFVAGLVAGLLLLVGLSLAIGIANAGKVMPGVRVADVDVSGLDAAAVEARLAGQLPSLSTGSATLVADEIEVVVGYDELGRRYELEEMVEAALAVARSDGPLADGVARLRALIHRSSLPVIVRGYDEAALARVAGTISERVEIAPVDAAVVPDGGQFDVTAAQEGRSLAAIAVHAALAAPLGTADPADVRVRLEPTAVAPEVSNLDALRASRQAQRTAAALQLTLPGTPTAEELEALALTPETIAGWIAFGTTEDGTYGVTIDAAAVDAAVQALVELVDQEAVNASFAVAGGGLGGVIPGNDGRQLQVEESSDALLAALEGRAAGRAQATLLLDVTIEEPALSTAAAEAALPQMRMVSSWTTNYVPGVSNGFGANISIPAGDIDGTTVAPGDWFSFWGGLGPINTARGYTYGGAIINGRSEPEGALAGGICSTSTTLFNAAMRLGLEIGERDNHYYYIDRYPTGLDATVFASEGFTQDMTFRNDTEHPLVIRGFGSPGRVTFQIWSVPNGRTVALSAASTSNHTAATDTTRVDPNMAPGTSRRIESPHNGFNASVSRTVRDADGNIVHQDNWFSDYRAVNGVVVTGPNAPAAPAQGDGGTAGGGAVPPPTPAPTP
ncbi:MAG: VanW family protein [Chloroflexota bacterium]